MNAARLQEGQRGDKPDSMFGVPRDRGICGTVVGAVARPLGDAGQETAGPVGSVVSGGSEANGAGAAIEDAANLEGGDDGGAIGEGIWLDFAMVVGGVGGCTGGLGEGIGADVCSCGQNGARKGEGHDEGNGEGEAEAGTYHPANTRTKCHATFLLRSKKAHSLHSMSKQINKRSNEPRFCWST